MRLLNIGAGPATLIPDAYADWDIHTCDIDPAYNPDVLADMRALPADVGHFDAVYASHCLEHIAQHEVVPCLRGWSRVAPLVHVRVPNAVMTVLVTVALGKLLTDPIYDTPGGPVSANDVLHGHHKYIEQGNDYYAHKTSFGPRELRDVFELAGLTDVLVQQDAFDLIALGRSPT